MYVLAKALRTLFDVVETANRRTYALEHHFNPSVVTVALGGKKRPSWDFIEKLTKAAARDRGDLHLLGSDLEDIVLLRDLYEKAKPKKVSVEELIATERAKNQEEIDQWIRRERDLTAEIARLQAALQDLGFQHHALGDGTVQPFNHAIAEQMIRQSKEIESQRRSVRGHIYDLGLQLEQERQLRKEAEQRCRDYEALMEKYDEAVHLYMVGQGADPADDTELLFLDGHHEAVDRDERYPAALVNLLRSQVEELGAENQELQNQLKAALDEIHSTPWWPLPEAEPEPARHRRLESAVPEAHEEVLMPGSDDWTTPRAVNDGLDLPQHDRRYRGQYP